MTRGKIFLTALVVIITLLGSVVVFYRFARADDVAGMIERCRAEGYKAQQCLNDLVVQIGKEKGLDAGFDALQSVYFVDSDFASSCHGTTHELGSQAYDSFERGIPPRLSEKMSYCGFGFFHGFIEIFLQTGRPLAEARKFCDDARNELGDSIAGVSAGCYHGIGHGVVDGTDPATWGNDALYIKGGLELCARLGADEESTERCASGVFNALANVYDNDKYALRLDADDPYRICRSQTEEWSIDACYDQMNGLVNRLYPTFTDALLLAAQTSEPSHRETAIRAVASHRAQDALSGSRPLADYLHDCSVLALKWRIPCVNAFAVGLVEFGKPQQEFIAATDACEAAAMHVSECLSGVVGAVKDRLDPQVRAASCEYIARHVSQREGEVCVSTMAL